MITGVELIAAERQRQIEAEGYTSDRDDAMTDEQLAYAALCYLLYETEGFEWNLWPWDHRQFKPKNTASNLVRAGALIAAEIDRLQRVAKVTDHEHQA